MAQADRSRLQQAIALHQQGNLPLAEILYRGWLAEHPQDAQALGLLGLVEAANGKTVSAIELLRRSVQLDPAQAPAQFNLALLLQEQGQDEEALACFRQVTGLRPDAAPAHNGCGMALKRLGRYDEALQAYHAAVRLAPDFTEAWNNLGVVLRMLGRFGEAAQAFRRAAALVTDSGGVTSHAAIVSRELRIPCVVGTRTATAVLRDGEHVTVDGSKGRVTAGAPEVTVSPAPVAPRAAVAVGGVERDAEDVEGPHADVHRAAGLRRGGGDHDETTDEAGGQGAQQLLHG